MITDTIIRYLGANRRLVIPQLGTLIVKEPGQSVVFSELLKRDDGVLRGLLTDEGMSEVAAAGEIDRLVFEIRHAVQQGEEFHLAGLGVMRPGANGTIAFVYDPRPAAAPAVAAEPVAAPAEPSSPVLPDAAKEPKPLHETFSPKIQPEECLKGLRYGKPRKVGDGYAYVRNGRRKVDRFLVVAIIAAIVAVGVIIFGYVCTTRDKQAEAEATEQLITPTEEAQTTPAQ